MVRDTLLPFDDQTIIARCTPAGNGAIALLRLSGTHAVIIADALAQLTQGKTLHESPSHTIHYGWIINRNQEKIDQVLFLLMRAPSTFTGQDTVEITCHNNQFLIEHILALAIEQGARLAQEGEFTRRAVLNNKIDLIQAEAINELIGAHTQHALKTSFSQLQGSFSSFIAAIEQELLKAIAFCEASFEFIDEEMLFDQQIKESISTVLQKIAQLQKTFNKQQHIRSGIKIALIGSVNAGKSSLFNALLNQPRSIVTNIAGTTRDAIEAVMTRNGNFWTLIDTAGLRTTDDMIEQEGIRRSWQQAQHADIILLIIDNSRPVTDQEHALYSDLMAQFASKIIVVLTKDDLRACAQTDFITQPKISVSATTRLHLDLLEEKIEEKIQNLFQSLESPFLLNQRHHNLLLALENRLLAIQNSLQTTIAYEIISYQLNDAIAHVSELTGKTISESAMDGIFRQFCVGK